MQALCTRELYRPRTLRACVTSMLSLHTDRPVQARPGLGARAAQSAGAAPGPSLGAWRRLRRRAGAGTAGAGTAVCRLERHALEGLLRRARLSRVDSGWRA